MSKIGIVISGTKQGFKNLYASEGLSEDDKRSIVYDARQLSPSENAIGNECYGLSFTANGKVFSIYRAVYDGLRNMAVGFLSISLFVPLGVKIDGQKVQSLLDNLMKAYRKYAPNDKLDEQKEDWEFVVKLLNEISPHLKLASNHEKSWSSGTKEAAYIYCNKNILNKYFEDVYQNQYSDYREVLLIDESLKDKNNILLAIKNSEDITNQIDIENPEYTLKIIPSDGVNVKVNGKKVQDDEKVKKNQTVSIEFARIFYIPKPITGTYRELLRSEREIITVDESARRITIHTPTLPSETILIKLNITDEGTENLFEEYINKLTCRQAFSNIIKPIGNEGELKFNGDEIGQKWELIVEADDQYDKFSKPLYPENAPDTFYIRLIKKSNTHHHNKEEGNKKQPKSLLSLKWRSVLMVAGGVLTLLTAIYFAVNFLIPDLFNKNSENTILVIPSALIRPIDQYTQGMNLKLDSLESFKRSLKYYDNRTTEPPIEKVTKKIDNAIKVREAINGDNITYIQNVYKNAVLADGQNELLKLIIDSDFEYFTSINNRDNMNLNDIKFKLDSIISVKKTSLTSTSKSGTAKEQSKGTQGGSSNGQKQEESSEFRKMVREIKVQSDIDKFDKKNYLNSQQRELLSKIKNDIGGFKQIKNKDKLEWSDLENEIRKL